MIKFTDVTFTYPGSAVPAIRQVDLNIPASELVLLCGESGAGKSTLLRCVNGLVPHFSGGTLQGSIRVNGLDPILASPQVMSRHVGFVFQDPEAQFVVDQVEDEIAFALENAAIPSDRMMARIEDVLQRLGLAHLRSRKLETLSGGEQQRVAIAAALALQPQVLVLDEPTSQLDPQSAEELLLALQSLNRDLGITILLAEHRLERVLPFAHRLVHLDAGRPGVLDGPPRLVLAEIDLPVPLATLGKALGWKPLPLSVVEGRERLEQTPVLEPADRRSGIPQATAPPRRRAIPANPPPILQVTDLEVAYDHHPALSGINLDAYPGEILVVLGANGAGKSTLLRSLVGLVRPASGQIALGGQDISRLEVAEICQSVGFLPQDPNALLFADTVSDELMITLNNHRLEAEPFQPEQLLARLKLDRYAHHYPRDLSAGERQRVALAAIMVTRPRALLLDEPTRGLDYHAKQELARLLQEWRDEHMAIVLVTHDVELAAKIADRVLILDHGKIAISGEPARTFRFFPELMPQIAQLFPDMDWLTVQEALEGLKKSSRTV